MPYIQINQNLVEITDEEAAATAAEIATADAAMLEIANRDTRNELLAASDWTQGNDSPLTDEAKTSWGTYRSSLRSLPEHENWPSLEDADWPTAPE